ncbi:MAG: FAD-dependent oxidoreductase [Nanoarchaeota archaeon]|nr:FAD-dependent oxidoreductase [Nanoarchaeota archaeon]
MVGTYEVVVSNIERQGRIILIKLDFNEGVSFDFVPGQYVMVNYHDDNGDFKRSYSISSDPEHKNSIELCIALKEGGRGSAVLDKVKQGDKLAIMGPLGKFHLEESPGNDVVFIAGGTGISPLRSMLKHLLNIDYPGHVTLFYSFRTEADCLYEEEFRQLAKEHPKFTLVPTCTRADASWKGETQYVQDIFTKYVKGNSKKDVYACGPVPMVDAVFESLRKLGFKDSQLHREIWGA